MDGYGLVLGGGGGKGAYQVGVWKALAELGYTKKIVAVSGTSVGALNAALYVSKTVDEAVALWENMKVSDLMDFGELVPKFAVTLEKMFEKRTLSAGPFKKGLFSRKGLRDMIVNNNICQSVMESQIPVFACYKQGSTAMYGDLVYKDMRECTTEDEVIDVLFSSSAIPGIFSSDSAAETPGVKVDGGFYGDNIPVKPLYDLGIRKFIVVGLHPNRFFDQPYYYYDAEFVYIKPTENIYLGATGTRVIDDGLIDFDGKNAAIRIQLGYNEGLFQLRRKFGTPKLQLLQYNSSNYTFDKLKQVIFDCSYSIANENSAVYVGDVPQDKLDGAVEGYAKELGEKRVIALFDNSKDKSGRSGFLLTDDSIIFDAYEIPFREITAIETTTFLADIYNGNINIYHGAGQKTVYGGVNCNKNAMKQMLERIKTVSMTFI